jgi:hypothetical protein
MYLPIRSACLFSLFLLGCAHAPKTSPARGVVLSMTRLTVKPTPENNPGASWDQGPQESNDDEGCGLLVALDLFAPGVGSVASAVCSFNSSSSDGGQYRAEDPDLFVAFELGAATYTSPVIVDRPSHDLRYSLFIPQAALRGEELRVAVYDLDGADRRDSTLIADRDFTAAQLDGKIELRGEALGEPSLEILRLEIDEAPRPQAASRSMSAASSLLALDDLDIPAGMLVEIRATGSYSIGSWNDAKLGPDGYPGGTSRLQSPRHGVRPCKPRRRSSLAATRQRGTSRRRRKVRALRDPLRRHAPRGRQRYRLRQQQRQAQLRGPRVHTRRPNLGARWNAGM